MSDQTDLPRKPIGVIASLAGGLDAVIQGWWILLFPLALDLFLWFGSRLSIQPVAERMIAELIALVGENPAFDLLLEATRQLNYLSVISVAPLGIPSLMSVKIPDQTPLGVPNVLLIDNELVWIALFLFFSVLGLLLGGVYLGMIAQQVRDGRPDPAKLLRVVPRYWLSITALAIALVLLASIGALPLLVLATLLASISAGLASLVVWIGFMVFMWLAFHLAFSIHAMLLSEMSLPRAVWTSIRLTAYNSFPTMGLLALALGISAGMNYLWSLPRADSWMLLVGIVGHALISSGLLAATFVYYQDRYRYWRELRVFLSNSANQHR